MSWWNQTCSWKNTTRSKSFFFFVVFTGDPNPTSTSCASASACKVSSNWGGNACWPYSRSLPTTWSKGPQSFTNFLCKLKALHIAVKPWDGKKNGMSKCSNKHLGSFWNSLDPCLGRVSPCSASVQHLYHQISAAGSDMSFRSSAEPAGPLQGRHRCRPDSMVGTPGY